jgi:hypothetical protein
MGLDYSFFCQKRANQGWIDVACAEGSLQGPPGFTWIDDKDVVRHLFWGDRSLFAMRRDLPPDIASTLLFQRCGQAAFSEWYHSWLPFDELLLDLWDESFVFFSKQVAPKYVNIFGDGQQPFPRGHLLAAGMPEQDVDRLQNTSYYEREAAIVNEPVDWESGKNRFELANTRPNYLLWVTWKVSVSSCLGDWRAREFRGQRRYGNDEELRIVCLFS